MPISIAAAAGTNTARARRLKSDDANPSSIVSAAAASVRLIHSWAAIHIPAPVTGSASET
jgi:hypothetical protein